MVAETDPGELSIVADWGTSQLRVMLCDGDRLVDQRVGPGIGAVVAAKRPPSEVFTDISGEWLLQYGSNGVVLCGMVGSSMGWVEAPYAECPASLAQLASAAITVEAPQAKFAIIPGLACINHLGAPDVMRGEETQILGAMVLLPLLGRGRHIACLPGTHSKWAVIEDGIVQNFTSAPTGELFAVLAEHSVLVQVSEAMPFNQAAFDAGVERSLSGPACALPFLLFETRSRTLMGGMPQGAARDFLSGLLIGVEIRAAKDACAYWGVDDREVILIGEPDLTDRYTRALALAHSRGRAIDGSAAVLAGLLALRRTLMGQS